MKFFLDESTSTKYEILSKVLVDRLTKNLTNMATQMWWQKAFGWIHCSFVTFKWANSHLSNKLLDSWYAFHQKTYIIVWYQLH